MHPLLATRGRILLYLAGWVPILVLLDYLMWASGGASWEQNTAVLGPACVLFAFACLSPWPMCRVRPLRLADAAMLAVTWGAAAAAASALFTGAAWAMARIEGLPAAHLDLLFGVGRAAESLPPPRPDRRHGKRLSQHRPTSWQNGVRAKGGSVRVDDFHGIRS